MSNENKLIYPFLIIIFSLLLFFGLLRLRKMNLLENNLEKYINLKNEYKENFLNKKIKENFIDENINNSPSSDYIKYILNGNWTTINSKCDSNKVISNTMNIELNKLSVDSDANDESELGTIILDDATYNVIFASTTNLTARAQNVNSMSLSIVFNSKLENEPVTDKPLNDPNTFNGVMSIFIDNDLVYKYAIYKVNSDGIASSDLCRIVQSNDILVDQPPPIYDVKAYNIIINNYKFPSNFVSIEDWTINKDVMNIIREKYFGKIQFGIQRVFNSPASKTNEIISYMSQPLILECIDGEQIPKTLSVVPFEEDKNINELQSFFVPKATMLFFFKFKNTDVTYEFGDTKLMENPSTTMNFKNGASKLMKSKLKFNNINSVQLVNTNNYEVTYITRVNSDYSSPTIISFSEIYPLL